MPKADILTSCHPTSNLMNAADLVAFAVARLAQSDAKDIWSALQIVRISLLALAKPIKTPRGLVVSSYQVCSSAFGLFCLIHH